MLADLLGTPIVQNDVVICVDQDDQITVGVVKHTFKDKCVVNKILTGGEERYEVPARHLCIIERTRLNSGNPFHKTIIDYFEVNS